MKVYKVKVNGKVYEVELESVSEKAGNITASPKQDEKVEVKSAPVASGDGVQLKSPMQGTIIKLNVEVGSQVKKGQCVLLLEAMKLENEIVAPADGTVKQILVSKGQQVNSQQVLLIIG